MRLVFRIDLTPVTPRAADGASIALTTVLFGAHAQDAEPAQSAHAGAAASSEATITRAGSSDARARTAAAFRQVANSLSISADAASMNDFSLDDRMLSRPRGSAVGMVMVAATPQFMRDNSGGCSNVTLWDEIAPPSPLPIPIDAARAAHGNVGTYQRK
jgi:hypothetical protein